MNSTTTVTLAAIEACVRRDPGRRGLISSEPERGALCAGELGLAAHDLAEQGREIAIVTGFYIPRGEPPAAETDGPPGTLMLAETLRQAGIAATVITDDRCLSAVQATADVCGFARERVLSFQPDADPRAFLRRFPNLSHLIALERVGPSHTVESLKRQRRIGPAPVVAFEEAVPEEHRNRCHNMRGEIIDEFTAGTHRLFEVLFEVHPLARVIGIGDGGNELGMGRIRWEELTARLSGPQAAWLPCRIGADWTIIAGTSNWGGYALAAATLLLRGQTHLLADWTASQQQRVVEHLVQHGPAVDGVTRRQEATVDGLPFLTYVQPWEAIRELIGLP